MSVLSSIGLVLVYLWLLFGPAILIAFSTRLAGRQKVLWVVGALAPIAIAVIGSTVIVKMVPADHLNPHSDFPPVIFGTLLAVWIVYGIYRWRYVASMTPNPTPHLDARDAEGNPDSPAARAGGRGR